ncbi:hypothetical protein Clacol_001508 [Clathrus columnatus]|uniref:Importin-7/11-like TPR repeats domain-containing protein n=1 Tax=Clathrus columnatus TaxID=1419009 RepID=A0AAV4ZYE6_9AGAM|nr:hypothetical protein Clacol_001508 [Clathrus columnatus]
MVVSKPTDPIDSQIIYRTVCDAASQYPTLVQASAKHLQAYLDHPGTMEQLQALAIDKINFPLDARRLAMIQFKNSVSIIDPAGRSRLFNVQSQATVRARALEFVFEEDNIARIADCNALIIAKIARSDVPSQWPSLIPDLANIIQTRADFFLSNPTSTDATNTLALRRTLHILDEVLEELSNLKLPSGVRTMASICEILYSPLVSIYDKFSGIVQNVISVQTLLSSNLQCPCENLIAVFNLIFSPCMKLMLWLWQKAGQPQFSGVYQTLVAFSQSCFTLFPKLFELRMSLILGLQQSLASDSRLASSFPSSVSKSINLLTHHIWLYGKMFRRMQQLSTKRFVQMPNANDIVLYYWNQIVKAANGSSRLIEDSPGAVYPVRIIVQGMVLFRSGLNAWANKENLAEKVLSQDIVEEAVRLLLTQFIPLIPGDLEKWSNDPEDWLNEEDKEEEAWEYSLREAVYRAIGFCSNRLQDTLDFDQWMQKNLIPEAQETNPNYRIIKRRIAWVVGRWLGDESRHTSAPLVWQLLRHLLQDRSSSSDPVVRLSAAVALTQCLDTTTFDINLFLPFVGDFVTLLTEFLMETDTWESKNKLVKALNMTIECSGVHVIPHVNAIIDPLPGLWQAASSNEGPDNLFKTSLVIMVTHLVESKPYLEDDGLQLWLTAIRCAPSTPGLIALFPRAITYMTENLDVLGTVMTIVESYIIADSNAILSVHAGELCAAFRSVLSTAVKPNLKELIRLISLIARMSPVELWAGAMHTSGLFGTLVKSLIEDKDDYTLLKEYNYAFARMMLSSPDTFNQLVMNCAPSLGMSETQVFEGLLDQWWAKFDVMAEPQNRKLVAMGIASWTSTGRHEVLDRLYSEVFNLWLDVFGELKEALADEDSRSPLTTFWRDSRTEPDDLIPLEAIKTLEAQRRRQIFIQDPVINVKLTDFIRESLQKAEIACGGADVFKSNYLAKADPNVLTQIQAALSTGH